MENGQQLKSSTVMISEIALNLYFVSLRLLTSHPIPLALAGIATVECLGQQEQEQDKLSLGTASLAKPSLQSQTLPHASYRVLLGCEKANLLP